MYFRTLESTFKYTFVFIQVNNLHNILLACKLLPEIDTSTRTCTCSVRVLPEDSSQLINININIYLIMYLRIQ